MVPPDRHALLRPLSHWFLDRARTSSAADAAAAEAVMAAYGAMSLVALADYDVVLCPTASGPPVPVGWFSEGGLDDEPRRMIGWSSGTPFANITGYGALSLPLAWTRDGLPIGVQLAMAPGRDHELFAVAASLMTAASPRPLPPMF
jgi:amidase